MDSVTETARKITCPTESDNMSVKRIVRYLKGAVGAKCLIVKCYPHSKVTNTTNSELDFC